MSHRKLFAYLARAQSILLLPTTHSKPATVILDNSPIFKKIYWPKHSRLGRFGRARAGIVTPPKPSHSAQSLIARDFLGNGLSSNVAGEYSTLEARDPHDRIVNVEKLRCCFALATVVMKGSDWSRSPSFVRGSILDVDHVNRCAIVCWRRLSTESETFVVKIEMPYTNAYTMQTHSKSS
ncbi:hypothetical protein K461DRAFT_282060 [Myriangium duriaei CBS 260.36]|uniref:Uncharacterized protein n=1 Tax=Myriangium duriaei CBS 260.36 TaxID=1168546 RepID=A0A9P4IZI9_9PEZI|nr:hypothetical protein K461DRAFT_282060 [Myriangium duriaei CBS 260.36]